MFPVLAMTAAQLSALIFIALLIVAGVVVMVLTPNDILNPHPDNEPDNDKLPSHDGGGADTLYKGVIVIFLIGLIGIAVTAFLH